MSTRPQWPDLLDPSFRKIYGDEVKQLPQMVPSIFTMNSSKMNMEKDSSASGLSKLVRRTESQAITYEDENQGYDVTYTHVEDSLGTSVSNLLWEDDQYNVIRRKPANLAKAKVRTQEQIGADIFNYGFINGGGGKSPFTGGDAVALFNASHTRTDGGTVQNNTTTADLAEDSLSNAEVAMRASLDDKGQLEMITPDTLLIPPALENEARILLNSTGRTGSGNNDINPMQGKFKIVVWDYLGSAAGGSDTAWFLMDSSYMKLNWFNRSDRGIEGPYWDFDTKTAKWTISCRWSVGFSDWRGLFGSKGDNS